MKFSFENKPEEKQDFSYVSIMFLVYCLPGNQWIAVNLVVSSCLKVDRCSLKTELIFAYSNVKNKNPPRMPCLGSELQRGETKDATK